MRIIAGTARGRRIFSVSKNLPVKPISDRIKQSLFDILRPRITGAIMLDLFAGTGNVSLEALSRGAMKTVMVDREPACIKNIHRNLAHLGFEDRAKVLRGDVLKPLDWVMPYSDNEGYDIIFMGPPYRDINNKMLSFSEPALKNVAEARLLAPNGIVVLQTHKTEEFAVPDSLEIYRVEKYGDTLVHFMRAAEKKEA
ncbi:MAG: 16S rRNA (guanine(966)-N(2))-methyltransferase RsmD [Elusimicrobium sp.]|jgi:16S rRNA (guanine(966)-N(2))-methyltransferase RsmD|uniref:16S rRNA (Guanine(966)-N(2))-methyltransferase RsmD n=1 Tax=Candidatus Avelusimicrobium gallicola TaxID=2562704 RepID=A0A928DN98_9BACT|nr:16S rRNA (guanine(966)-N(2))-methyltransferase RsmD [Elusimicrobium sp.]